MCFCLQPDDVEGKLREIIPPGFSCNTDDFLSLLEKEANFKPFGSLLHTYKVHNVEEGADLTYMIHKVMMEVYLQFKVHKSILYRHSECCSFLLFCYNFLS